MRAYQTSELEKLWRINLADRMLFGAVMFKVLAWIHDWNTSRSELKAIMEKTKYKIQLIYPDEFCCLSLPAVMLIFQDSIVPTFEWLVRFTKVKNLFVLA